MQKVERELLEKMGFNRPEDIILLFVGGSQLHGAKLEGTDDQDLYGVYIEPPHKALGLNPMPHFVASTSTKSAKNTSVDIDLVLYSLDKWAGMAVHGNPTALNFLFAPPLYSSNVWREIKKERISFIQPDHANRYLGYARDQLARLMGIKGQKNVNRSKLEKTHGYDTKYAMHVIRLLLEGIELMETREVTLPCKDKDYLIEIRKGEIPVGTVITKAWDLISQLEGAQVKAIQDSRFEGIDRDKISRLMSNACLWHWGY